MEVHDEPIATFPVGQQQGEWPRTIEVRCPAQEPLTAACEIGGALARELLEVDRGELLGDLPAVADIGGTDLREPRAGERMRARRLMNGGPQAPGVDVPLHAELEVHAPRLLFA